MNLKQVQVEDFGESPPAYVRLDVCLSFSRCHHTALSRGSSWRCALKRRLVLVVMASTLLASLYLMYTSGLCGGRDPWSRLRRPRPGENGGRAAGANGGRPVKDRARQEQDCAGGWQDLRRPRGLLDPRQLKGQDDRIPTRAEGEGARGGMQRGRGARRARGVDW